jgi:ribosome-associated translation inhibitor RaiA
MGSLILTLRGVERSGALESRVREIHERLQRCNERMTLCHVTIVRDAAQSPQLVQAKIHVSVPGAQIHADSGDHPAAAHSDVFAALRDAYSSARRQLRDIAKEGAKSSLVETVKKLTGRR